MDFLAQRDHEDETTQAALSGDYGLVMNQHVGYVSLLRRHAEPPVEA